VKSSLNKLQINKPSHETTLLDISSNDTERQEVIRKSSSLLVQWETSLVADEDLVIQGSRKAVSFTSTARVRASM